MTIPGPAGIAHIVWFGIAVPVLGVRSLQRIGAMPLPPRPVFYATVILQQTVFLGFSLLVAWSAGLPLSVAPPDGRGWLLAGAFLVVSVAILAPEWRRRIRSRDRRVLLASPMTRPEHGLWVVVSALAGVSEEITYRGVLYLLLVSVTGSPLAAVGLAALAFAVGHAVQGWRAAAIVFAIAVGFHGLVLVTGSLVPAIVVHALYDTIAGFASGRMARRADFTEAPPPAAEIA